MDRRWMIPDWFAPEKTGDGGDLQAIERETERLVGDMTRAFGPLPSFAAELPRADVSETPDGIRISLELPGVDEKNITVERGDGVLSVRGEKSSEHEDKHGRRVVTERSYGSFERTFPAPENLSADAVTAEFDRGVLKIRVRKPAAPAKAPGKIPVRPAA